jgi:hypothetical protein
MPNYVGDYPEIARQRQRSAPLARLGEQWPRGELSVNRGSSGPEWARESLAERRHVDREVPIGNSAPIE